MKRRCRRKVGGGKGRWRRGLMRDDKAAYDDLLMLGLLFGCGSSSKRQWNSKRRWSVVLFNRKQGRNSMGKQNVYFALGNQSHYHIGWQRRLKSNQNGGLLASWNAATSKAHIVVAKDGSGNYKTINNAIAALARMVRRRSERAIIYLKSGVYNEKVEIGRKMKNLMFVGNDIDKTIITGSRNVVDGATTLSSTTFGKLNYSKLMNYIPIRTPSVPAETALRNLHIRLLSAISLSTELLSIIIRSQPKILREFTKIYIERETERDRGQRLERERARNRDRERERQTDREDAVAAVALEVAAVALAVACDVGLR
ncbi:hypothetical protein HYC85_010976 [Camellia sinensis]|uniref:Pectinesterase catalytic domain-containing protein n=1 Tax=Camellia sinensis TaxID=4442 RepID=A0A7J7HJF9_CAMSI|nr:hypothetical protein HYC85_010976 [Camellia sinensis]